jgi:glucose/arabinose dehydrogenase
MRSSDTGIARTGSTLPWGWRLVTRVLRLWPVLVPAVVASGLATLLLTEVQGADRPVGPVTVERAFPDVSFVRPTFLTHAGDGSDRLYVLEQRGVMWTFDPAGGAAEQYLDLRDRVNSGGEEGLLGLAFDPAFESNGYFYLYYSAADPRRTVLSRFSVGEGGVADASSELVILEVPQPYANHNGGMIAFGRDGYLFVALGDGGSGGDPHGHGQNLGTLLGSILRIDVREASAEEPYRVPRDNPFVGDESARAEIWAYGFRNPWRFSFDNQTGALWAGDVGQSEYEEIDLVQRGGNYGWNIMEGFHCFGTSSCDQSGLELPVVEYSHDLGCSVTGGYVYRGRSVPSLRGVYVYADLCSGIVWGLRYNANGPSSSRRLVEVDFRVPSFGVDAQGELYLLGFDGGIHRFVDGSTHRRQPDPPPGPRPRLTG